MKNIYIFLLMIVALTVLLSLTRPGNQGTLFTCTTFFDYEKEDKWKAFCQGIDSILAHHPPETLGRITDWLIVNEYSANPKANWRQRLANKYPFLTVIQKGAHQKGQAASLNIILEQVDRYQYWIQWEEAWYATRECLTRAFAIMDSTQITQLQMTQTNGATNWSNLGPDIVHCGPEFCIVDSPTNLKELLTWDPEKLYEYPNWLGSWPRFSLCPSINRAAFYTFGPFRTDPSLWPVKFEWEYGRRWAQRGGLKAILPDGPVQQNSGHKSTYK
jgi:hypothetical protein